jgi:drug/metabolite transporter (DMT)-like permease
MNYFDRQRLLTVLMLLAMAFFVASGTAFAGRWRRQFRLAAIVGFLAALAIALVEIAVWLRTLDR